VIRVFLLDDHELVRRGLRDLLETEDDLEVTGEASTAEEALRRLPAARPDVAVLDVRLPDGSGVEVCREIRSAHPDVHCLMLTSFADDEALFDAIMAGASGYVLKQVRGNELVEDIRRVAAGQSLLDPAVTARVLDRLDQLLRRRPLEQVGRGAGQHGRDERLRVGVGGQHHDLRLWPFLAQRAAHLDAAAVGQAHVQHHDVRLPALCRRQRLGGGARLADDEEVLDRLEEVA